MEKMYHLPNHTQCRSSNVLFSLLLSVHFGSVYMVDSKTERKSLSSYCLELGHLHQVCYIQWTFLFNTKKTRKYIKLWYHRLVVGGYYRDSNFFNAHTRTHTHTEFNCSMKWLRAANWIVLWLTGPKKNERNYKLLATNRCRSSSYLRYITDIWILLLAHLIGSFKWSSFFLTDIELYRKMQKSRSILFKYFFPSIVAVVVEVSINTHLHWILATPFFLNKKWK